MKVLNLLTVLCFISCASVETLHHSIAEILVNPEHFEGKKVSVCGWFVAGMEQCTVSQLATETANLNTQVEIWVTPDSNICMPINWQRNPVASWAIVEGTFYTGSGFGHLGMYQHLMIGGSVNPIQGECSGEIATHNKSLNTDAGDAVAG